MNVLILGQGGREHALVESLNKSKLVQSVYSLNGNPGMIETTLNIKGNETIESIVDLCIKYQIEWVIPGGETYLSKGITDELLKHNIHVFGPTKKAALIETSKAYAKMIMEKYDVPTAKYEMFSDYVKAVDYLKNLNPPYVIKYDGLAFGKGVTIAQNIDEAKIVLDNFLKKKIYGNGEVLIEDFLVGEEYSMICLVHKQTVIPLPLAKDHKARFEDNKGPNTGGMGAYSPVDFVNSDMFEKSLKIMRQVAHGMVLENNPFVGFLYGGFILTEQGPKIIEFNCRLGDPEAEVILPRVQSDLMDLILNISKDIVIVPKIDENYHLGVVLVSDGYPDHYEKGKPLAIPLELKSNCLHMGTNLVDNHIVTNGGRVLFIKGIGSTLKQARENAYKNVDLISHDFLKYRKDIGL